MRFKIIRLITYVLFVVIVLDLFYIQVIRGNYFYHLSKNNRIRVVPLTGWRGKIFDRHGLILADNRVSYNVMVIPQEIKNFSDLFEYLSRVLEVKRDELENTYSQRRYAPFAPVVVAEDISREKVFLIEENKYRFPGLMVEESFRRFYPWGSDMAHVLGYVGRINLRRMAEKKSYGYSPQSIVGYTGVEEYYDQYLKAEEGGFQIEVNSRGRQVRLLSFKEPLKGKDITLTVDARLQQLATRLLEGRRGAIIVLDVDSGEIIGLVSSPSYDPNALVDKKKSQEASRYLSDSSSPLLNRAMTAKFPPGSVFKVAVALGALHSKKITAHTTFTCDGAYSLGGITFGCPHAHGEENLTEAIAHSCNIYFYNAGAVLGADLMNRYAHVLGLGNLTLIDLPYEEFGFIPSPQQRTLSGRGRWYKGDTLNFAIGQGDTLTTPLQLTTMMAVIAKEGVVVHPHVIKMIGPHEVLGYSFGRKIKIDKNALKVLQQALRAAVSFPDGTAHDLAAIEEYEVLGKTGTAQSAKDKENHSWFVGYTRGAKKNIAFCVFLEYGGSSHQAVLLTKELLLNMNAEDIL